VIAANFPLWRDIVEGADCGSRVEPLDAETLASTIRWIIAERREAREPGENGRRTVADTYNWEHEGRKLTARYRRLPT
jgi:hypothetical protein